MTRCACSSVDRALPSGGRGRRFESCQARHLKTLSKKTNLAHNPSLTYRPDIDGLRAIAVLLVLIFHAFPTALPGGFIGVDIFFVISGYLISSIIFKGLDKGNFSLRDFYARRIRRIFPCLILVLAVCLGLGWLFFFPDEINQLGKHMLKSSFFVLNFSLADKGGYFDIGNNEKPLLHLWSLCVEEQYYILWPAMMMAAWKYKRRAAGPVLFGLLALSFVVSCFLTHSNSVQAFYFPTSRFWELLIGSALAYTTLYRPTSLSSPTRNLLSVIGVVLILTATWLINETTLFPGAWALLPTLGAFCIIQAGTDAWINKKILQHPCIVAIGLISYPLYMWHWPILSFLRIMVGEAPPTSMILIGLLSAFILASATYLLMEKKIRFSPKKDTTFILVIAMIALGIAGFLLKHGTIQGRMSNEHTKTINEALVDWQYPGDYNFKKMDNFETYEMSGKKDETVLIIGDSHAEQYWPRLNKIHSQRSPTLLFTTYGACPPLPVVERLNQSFACNKFFNYALHVAEQPQVKKVVFVGYWGLYFGLRYGMPEAKPNLYSISDPLKKPVSIDSQAAIAIFDEFEKIIKDLTKQGKKVYIILSVPTAPQYHPKDMISRVTLQTKTEAVDRKAFVDYTSPATNRLKALAAKTGAILIDPVPSLCDKDICPTTTKDGLPVYKDGNHLRPFYMIEKGKFIDRILQ